MLLTLKTNPLGKLNIMPTAIPTTYYHYLATNSEMAGRLISKKKRILEII